RRLMPPEVPEELPGRHVPQAHGLVVIAPARRQKAAVGGEPQRVGAVLGDGERTDLLSRGEVPHPDVAVQAPGGQGLSAVREGTPPAPDPVPHPGRAQPGHRAGRQRVAEAIRARWRGLRRYLLITRRARVAYRGWEAGEGATGSQEQEAAVHGRALPGPV